ncbi:MAG: transposase [Simplicispira sp.]|nr:transposase [Simplicispira sp.]
MRVLFGDESGFTENPPLTLAWAPKGEPHAHEMKSGTRARLNGIGCCDFNLKPVSMWFKEGRVGGADFRAWGSALAAKCNPLVSTHLCLDNGQTMLAHVPSHHDHAVGEWIGIRAEMDHVVTFAREA